jgi:SAM-dependent methyltransferase
MTAAASPRNAGIQTRYEAPSRRPAPLHERHLSPSNRVRTRRALVGLGVLCVAAVAAAQDFPRYGDEVYQPRLRQPGKDVMWLPTPDAMVTRMLEAAKTTDRDVVYDLGAGEGRIPIAAARAFGARAVGIEYDAALAALAKRNALRAGVADRVTIIEGDLFKEDFSQATVVTLYLLPDLNYQLRPTLLKMEPGTRVVSYLWDMGEWEPDEAFTVEKNEAFLWRVPASVAGRWLLREERGEWQGEVALTQQFQRVGGTLTLAGRVQPLLGAYVNGATLGFTFIDRDGAVRSLRAQVDGDRLAGQLRFAGNVAPVIGRRQ